MERSRPAPPPAEKIGAIRTVASAAKTFLRTTEVILLVTGAVACGPAGDPKPTQATPSAGTGFSSECPGGMVQARDAHDRPFTACLEN